MLPLATERLSAKGQSTSELVTAALVVVPQVVTAIIAAWLARQADEAGRTQHPNLNDGATTMEPCPMARVCIQTVARGCGLVAEVQRLVAVAELANQLGNGIGCIVKLAEIPNLALRPPSPIAIAFLALAVSIATNTSLHLLLVRPLALRIGPDHPGNSRSFPHMRGEPPQALSRHAVLAAST